MCDKHFKLQFSGHKCVASMSAFQSNTSPRNLADGFTSSKRPLSVTFRSVIFRPLLNLRTTVFVSDIVNLWLVVHRETLSVEVYSALLLGDSCSLYIYQEIVNIQ